MFIFAELDGGVLSGEHIIEQDAQRIEVGADVGLAEAVLLGGGKAYRAKGGSIGGFVAFINFSYIKVDNLDIIVIAYYNIIRLYITMNDTAAMKCVKSDAYAAGCFDGFILAHITASHYFGDVHSVAVFLVYDVAFVVFGDFQDTAEVGAAYGGELFIDGDIRWFEHNVADDLCAGAVFKDSLFVAAVAEKIIFAVEQLFYLSLLIVIKAVIIFSFFSFIGQFSR